MAYSSVSASAKGVPPGSFPALLGDIDLASTTCSLRAVPRTCFRPRVSWSPLRSHPPPLPFRRSLLLAEDPPFPQNWDRFNRTTLNFGFIIAQNTPLTMRTLKVIPSVLQVARLPFDRPEHPTPVMMHALTPAGRAATIVVWQSSVADRTAASDACWLSLDLPCRQCHVPLLVATQVHSRCCAPV